MNFYANNNSNASSFYNHKSLMPVSNSGSAVSTASIVQPQASPYDPTSYYDFKPTPTNVTYFNKQFNSFESLNEITPNQHFYRDLNVNTSFNSNQSSLNTFLSTSSTESKSGIIKQNMKFENSNEPLKKIESIKPKKKHTSEINFREFTTKKDPSKFSKINSPDESNTKKGRHHTGPIVIKYIENNLERAKAKKRRKETLFEKANELSILAGVDVCVMVKDGKKLDYFFTKGDVLEEKIKNNLKSLF